jgi:hypothetical protein
MLKAALVTVRVTPDLKAAIERIGLEQGRSLSQVSELLLKAGLDAYRKEGPMFLQKFVSRSASADPKKRS